MLSQISFLQWRKQISFFFCSFSPFLFCQGGSFCFSHDHVTEFRRAERFVDAEILAKLRQASAENFARCLHLGKVNHFSFVRFYLFETLCNH